MSRNTQLLMPFCATLAAITVMGVVAAPLDSHATTLACRPGVRTHLYAYRYVRMSYAKSLRLHAALERYGDSKKLNVSGVEGSDPYSTPTGHNKVTFLESQSFGIVIAFESTNQTRFAKLTVKNNCYGPPEDWRPYWRDANAFIDVYLARPSPARIE